MQYKTLRKKYPKFVYENYSWQIVGKDLNIFFYFKIPADIEFCPKIIIKNVNQNQIKKVGASRLNNLVFHLGLIELFSYWKATCSPQIEIRAGQLNREQILWWKNLIINGMGQFFYENKINFLKSNFLKLNVTRKVLVTLPKGGLLKNKILVPVGGGKDSIVTLEILKNSPSTSWRKRSGKIKCFSLNPTKPAKEIMKIGECQKPIIIIRKIDKKLLELNQKGYLNGHTPFSAYLAFLSVLVATIFGYQDIAFSNERSSNEGNVNYLERVINHQYSKSFDFEKKFRKYSKKHLTPNVEYFSFLRPLYEIQIARLFSRYPKYFRKFLSCNVAFQTDSGRKKPIKKWCGRCPKCLFIFASLYPFVESKELIKIFGKNLFSDKDLLPIMLQLIGEKDFKPFECVGTEKESRVAFYLSWKTLRQCQGKKDRGRVSIKLPFLLNYFEEKVLPQYPELKKEAKKILNSWDKEHNLTEEFIKILKKAISKKD